MLLKDKVALITGAGDGIGKAIALALGESGAKVRPTRQRSSSACVQIKESLDGLVPISASQNGEVHPC